MEVFIITLFEIIAYIIGAVMTIVGTLSGLLSNRLSTKAKANITLSFIILPFLLCASVVIDILLGAPISKWPLVIFFMPFTFLCISIPQYIRLKRNIKENKH